MANIVRYIVTKSEHGLGPKAKPAQKKANSDKLAGSVDKLTVEETPKVKSKNLNVVEEFERSGMKQMANFVVIGMYTCTDNSLQQADQCCRPR
jgi:hypothetical protein